MNAIARRWIRLLTVVVSLGILMVGMELRVGVAIAAPDSSQQIPLEVRIHMGTEVGELKFVPNAVTFQAGQRYNLILDNPSPEKHYFTAKDFADSIWSQKVDVANVEVKGAIHELELKPGGEATWAFVPMKSGTYELHCSIPGHAAAGMVGTLTIER